MGSPGPPQPHTRVVSKRRRPYLYLQVSLRGPTGCLLACCAPPPSEVACSNLHVTQKHLSSQARSSLARVRSGLCCIETCQDRSLHWEYPPYLQDPSQDLVQQVARCHYFMQNAPLALLALLTHLQDVVPIPDRVKLAAALFKYGLREAVAVLGTDGGVAVSGSRSWGRPRTASSPPEGIWGNSCRKERSAHQTQCRRPSSASWRIRLPLARQPHRLCRVGRTSSSWRVHGCGRATSWILMLNTPLSSLR